MQIDVFDHPDPLLQEMSPETVFPSRFALRSAIGSDVLWGEAPRTLPLLWRELGDRFQIPPPLGDLALREDLRERLESLPLLRVLGDRSLEELAAHLQMIYQQIGRDFEPTNELEGEMQTLLGARSAALWQEEIIERLPEEQISDFVFAPLPSPRRQWGRFLRALAEQNEVRILLLLSPEMVEPYLRLAGLEGASLSTHFSRTGGMPFGGVGEPDIPARLLRGGAEAALDQEGDVLVAPSPFSNWREFLPLASDMGREFSFRTNFSVRDSVIGSRYLSEPREDIFGEQGEGERDLVWLTALSEEAERLDRLPPLSVFLESVYSPRIWRGSGPPLLSPGEAAAAFPRRMVFWGLEAERYPLPYSPSPFFSEELLRRYPYLRENDKRPVFVSSLLAAREEIILLADAEPSSFFLECERVWGEAGEAPGSTSPRSRARRLAAKGVRTPLLRKLEERLRTSDPQRPDGRTYSVTELEAFLRCPRGWFVSYRLRPEREPSPAQERGRALHRVLEEVFSHSPEDRLDVLREALPEEYADWQGRLERVIESWPGEGMMIEVPLEATFPFEDGEVSLRGRADRIDQKNGGILLIDWKTGALPSMSKDNLQASLYPLLAAQRLGQEPRGFLYISLRTGEYSGLTTAPLFPDIRPSWSAFSARGLRRAEEAIRRIESGEWKTIGERCGDWCPHHLLSPTGGGFG